LKLVRLGPVDHFFYDETGDACGGLARVDRVRHFLHRVFDRFWRIEVKADSAGIGFVTDVRREDFQDDRHADLADEAPCFGGVARSARRNNRHPIGA
jgi:hypothetical protein